MHADSALNEAIVLLAEDITRLSGTGDIQSIVHMEQPSGTLPCVLLDGWTALY